MYDNIADMDAQVGEILKQLEGRRAGAHRNQSAIMQEWFET
jgi:hypothetical protein